MISFAVRLIAHMSQLLTFLAIGFFAALFFLNFYFRVKILKIYKILVANRIEFGVQHIFNNQNMESEVLKRYPAYKADILNFSNHIKRSLMYALILVVGITIIGFIIKTI